MGTALEVQQGEVWFGKEQLADSVSGLLESGAGGKAPAALCFAGLEVKPLL